MINNNEGTTTSLNIPKELKIKLDILAKSDHLSFENLVISVLDNYAENEFNNGYSKME